MELIYLYINNLNRDLEVELSFNPTFTCKRIENDFVKITKNNVNLVRNYYGEYIRNFNLILGDNGVGKSTIFDAICDNDTKASKVLLLYYDSDENKFYLKKNYLSIILKYDLDSDKYEEINLNNFYKKKFLITNKKSNKFSLIELNKILSASYLDNINFYKRKMALVCFYYGDSKINISNNYQKDYEYIPIKYGKNISQFLEELKEYIVSSLFSSFIQNSYRVETFTDILELASSDLRNKYNDDERHFIDYMNNAYYVPNKYNGVPTFAIDLSVKNFQLMEIIEKFFDSITDLITSILNNKNEYSYSCRYVLPGLSSGEEQLLNNIISIFLKLNTIRTNNNEDLNEVLLCIDEPDNYLHPSWARKYVSVLVSALNKFASEKNGKFIFDVIISSHSPFLVSDFFKERINVIKMNEDNNISTRVVSKGKFGILSNIVDILLNDYFLDFPYGEYSLNKFIEIRNKLINEQSQIYNNEEINTFIKNIDDRVLRSILLDELDMRRRKDNNCD